MTDEELQIIVNNVLVDKDGFQFMTWLLDFLDAFGSGNNYDNVYMNYANNAVRQKGKYISNLILESNIEKYIQILEEKRNNGRKQQ